MPLHWTSRLDPLGERVLAIRRKQAASKPAGDAFEAEAEAEAQPTATEAKLQFTGLAPLNADEVDDELDGSENCTNAPAESLPAFEVEGVPTDCHECGEHVDPEEAMRWNATHARSAAQIATGLNGLTDVVMKQNTAIQDLEAKLLAVTTRVNELEIREDTLMKSLVESGALPGFRSLGA